MWFHKNECQGSSFSKYLQWLHAYICSNNLINPEWLKNPLISLSLKNLYLWPLSAFIFIILIFFLFIFMLICLVCCKSYFSLLAAREWEQTCRSLAAGECFVPWRAVQIQVFPAAGSSVRLLCCRAFLGEIPNLFSNFWIAFRLQNFFLLSAPRGFACWAALPPGFRLFLAWRWHYLGTTQKPYSHVGQATKRTKFPF